MTWAMVEEAATVEEAAMVKEAATVEEDALAPRVAGVADATCAAA